MTKIIIEVEGCEEEQVVIDKTHEANLAPEIRSFGGNLQYRYPNITPWTDFLDLEEIRGDPGITGSQGTIPPPYLHPFTNVQGFTVSQVAHQVQFVRSVLLLDQNHNLMSGEVNINPDTQLITVSFTRSFSGMAIIS